jgi:hypothetical protein
MFDCKCDRCVDGVNKAGGLGDDDARLVQGTEGLKEEWLSRDLGKLHICHTWTCVLWGCLLGTLVRTSSHSARFWERSVSQGCPQRKASRRPPSEEISSEWEFPSVWNFG